MNEQLHVGGAVYLLSTAVLVDDRRSVLKSDNTFAVFDRRGDIRPMGLHEQGVFHHGTRMISQLELFIEEHRPMLLSSTQQTGKPMLDVVLGNPAMKVRGNEVPHFVIAMTRSKILSDGEFYERLTVRSYANSRIEFTLRVRIAADFVDIFEVRGVQRDRRGSVEDPVFSNGVWGISYRGLDGVVRRSEVHAEHATLTTSGGFLFELALDPQQEWTSSLDGCLTIGERRTTPMPCDDALLRIARRPSLFIHGSARVRSNNDQFNSWIEQSADDLEILTSATPHGPYPYAGIPWYSTVFGRDAILTSFMVLWAQPNLARGVLAFLAAHQAHEIDPVREAQPGKIVHEMRGGEMAALNEVPFAKYYGTVDATPLFVILAAEYLRVTNDINFIRGIWDAIEEAIRWCDEYGDLDGDGFVEYSCNGSSGLSNQGWKDSGDAVFHADGSLACSPIALCEVQGYVFCAKQSGAYLAGMLGKEHLGTRWGVESEQMRERIEGAFWCEELGTYGLALDGEKRLCHVRTSNPGHLLFCGVPSRDRAARVVATLREDDLYSGWGVRTVSTREPRYNPMSYHNGSVWPHDNAIIALGAARYGYSSLAEQILGAMLQVASVDNLYRLPELFCGFERVRGGGPVHYPVACSPQAWAAAVPFCLLSAILGLRIDGAAREVVFERPSLPSFLGEVILRNLSVGPEAEVDVSLQRVESHVAVRLLQRRGQCSVISRS